MQPSSSGLLRDALKAENLPASPRAHSLQNTMHNSPEGHILKGPWTQGQQTMTWFKPGGGKAQGLTFQVFLPQLFEDLSQPNTLGQNSFLALNPLPCTTKAPEPPQERPAMMLLELKEGKRRVHGSWGWGQGRSYSLKMLLDLL